MADLDALTRVVRWAEDWSDRADGHAERWYADEAVVVDLAGTVLARGRDAAAELESALFRRVPHRAARPLIVHGDALVTGTSLGDLVTMVTPMTRWWWFDEQGRITRELRILDWDHRSIDDADAAGPLPRGDGPARSDAWFRDFAQRFAETWAWDPGVVLRSFVADDVVALCPTDPERRRWQGVDDVAATELFATSRLAPRQRSMTVVDVLGSGASLSLWCSLHDDRVPDRPAVGGLVAHAGLDGDDRIDLLRWRLAWSEAPDERA
jgi:hypothetical protein